MTLIPTSRPRWFDPRVILWALLGNDEDGVYGERSGITGYGEVSLLGFARWWLRNPFHNLCFHVLVWPRQSALVIYCSGHGWFHHHTPPIGWLDDQGHELIVSLAPAFVSFQRWGFEGYIGFRGYPGEFGMAFKRY